MPDSPYTAVASSMVANTDIVTARMAPLKLGPTQRTLSLTAPVGPSSEKGQLARQSMVLGAGAEALVCGWVDFVAGRAEVKDHRTLQQAFEARYRRPFDVREDEYRAFLQKLQDVLRELQVRAQVVGQDEVAYAPTDPATLPGQPLQGAPRGAPSALPFLLLLGALVVAGLAALFFLVF